MVLPQKHIIIFNTNIDDDIATLLSKNEWSYHNIFDYLGSQSDILDSIILNAPYYFDFDYEFENHQYTRELRPNNRRIRKKDFCTITPYCTFSDKKVTILNTKPSTDEISLLKQKGFNYYIKSDFQTFDSLNRLLTYIYNL